MIGAGQLMLGSGVLPRSSRNGDLGLYPTCRVEVNKAFHAGHCSDTFSERFLRQKCKEGWRSREKRGR